MQFGVRMEMLWSTSVGTLGPAAVYLNCSLKSFMDRSIEIMSRTASHLRNSEPLTSISAGNLARHKIRVGMRTTGPNCF